MATLSRQKESLSTLSTLSNPCPTTPFTKWSARCWNPFTPRLIPPAPPCKCPVVSSPALPDSATVSRYSKCEARRWVDRIIRRGAHDSRALIEGFRALKEAAPQIVTAHIPQVYSQVSNYLGQSAGRTERLRVLATFPWNDNDNYLSNALERLDEYWETVPDDDQHAVFQLVLRNLGISDVVARFHERLVVAVEADPAGRTSAVATKELTACPRIRGGGSLPQLRDSTVRSHRL